MVSDLTSREETRICVDADVPSKQQYTPIYVVVRTDGDHAHSKCFNYGAHLNELPTYAHLNHFFLFLYPDMNSIFVASFFFLNSLLVLIFFEYNHSLVRQLMRGLSYLLLFNLILFSIWLLTINTTSKHVVHVAEFVAAYVDRLLVCVRFLALYNHSTRFIASCARFVVFYYVHICPPLLFVNYSLVCVLFYVHTRYNFRIASQNSLLPIQQSNKPNQNRCSRVGK